MRLVDDDSIEAGDKIHDLERPLRFPAAAALISTIIEDHQSRFYQSRNHSIPAAYGMMLATASSSLSGVIVIDTPDMPGQIHIRSGKVVDCLWWFDRG